MKIATVQVNTCTHTSIQQHDHKRMVFAATCSLGHSQLDVTSHIRQMSAQKDISYQVPKTNMVSGSEHQFKTKNVF
jgi:hypothetical protein